MTTPSPTPVTIVKPDPAPAKKPRRSMQIGARLSRWNPDPRWAHPLDATLWVMVAGYVPFLGVPAWAMALAGPPLAVLGVARARRRWPRLDYGEALHLGMAWVHAIAGLTAGAWLVWAGVVGPLRAAGWLALAAVLLGGWYAIHYTTAPARAAEVDRVEAEQEVARAAGQWAAIFKAAGLALQVSESRPTRAGYVLAVKPAGDKPVSIDTLRLKVPELTVQAAATLAPSGVAVRDGDIRVEATDLAHIHLIHVCTLHVLGQTIPYEPIAEPTTIADPFDIGLYEPGQTIDVHMDGENAAHGVIIGASGSGKTTVVNAMIGRVGECVDALICVVATDKLVPLVYPWLRPWIDGRADRPAIDLIAGQDPKQILPFLAELYRWMKERNAQLSNASTHVATQADPAIVVFVEEAGDLGKRTNTIKTFDGQEMTASRLIHELTRAGRSALIHVEMVNQAYLYECFGAYGAEIARNTPLRICLKTMTDYDGRATLVGLPGTIDTTRLRDHSMLVQPPSTEPSVLPGKAYKLDGDDIHPVAIRNASWRPDPDLGPLWRDRWNAARHPELVAAARRDGFDWPPPPTTSDGDMDDLDRELRNIIDMETINMHDQPAPPPPAPSTSSAALPDADALTASLDAATARLGKALPLPEPLAAVMDILEHDGAPTDWVPTRELAIRLGRVARDADDADVRKAAQQLGRELSTIDADLRSVPRDRVQCYDVHLLRRVAAKIARGDA